MSIDGNERRDLAAAVIHSAGHMAADILHMNHGQRMALVQRLMTAYGALAGHCPTAPAAEPDDESVFLGEIPGGDNTGG